ncbi:rare lipoprotein A [Campylobacter showae]|nr:rare lipoprotein A [Campylobacter showae]
MPQPSRAKFIFFSLFFVFFMSGCSFLTSPSGGITASGGSKKSGKINSSKGVHEATMRPYTINGKTYYPTVVKVGDRASGIASWYGPDFHGKKTSNGETYDMHAMTAAHKTLPMNTMVRVTNIKNGKNIIVRINDRGPFVAGRVIDLSKTGAVKLDVFNAGTAPVLLEVVGFNGNVGGAVVASSQPSSKQPSGSQKTSTQTKAQPQQQSFVGGIFMVQIGAFKNLSGANAHKRQHAGQYGNGAYDTVIKSYDLDGGKIYRVFISGFRSEEEAKDFISAGHISGAFFVRE